MIHRSRNIEDEIDENIGDNLSDTCDNTEELSDKFTNSSLITPNSYISTNMTATRKMCSPNQRRRVHWEPTAKVVLIPQRDEYKRAGLDSILWWGGSDYISFRNSTAEELARCMQNLQISGREAMKVLYQSGCRQCHNKSFKNVVIAVPCSCTASNVDAEFKDECGVNEVFFNIVHLSCLVSAMDLRADKSDIRPINHIHADTSLLFEEVLHCHLDKSLLTQQNAILSCPIGSDKSDPLTSSNIEDFASKTKVLAPVKNLCGDEGQNVLRYSESLSSNMKCPRNLVYSRSAVHKDSLPWTWEDATQSDYWASVPIVITSNVHPFRVIHANKSWEELTGFDAKAFLGKTFKAIQGPLTSKSKTQKLREALSCIKNEHKYDKNAANVGEFPRKIVKVSLINYTKKGRPFNNVMLMGYIRKDNVSDLIVGVSFRCNPL